MGEEMKRILIFTHAMEIGGAERALLGLLESLDYTKCSVDLFLMRHSGELMQYIPNEVNILNEIPQYASLAVPIGNVLKKKHFSVAIGRTMGKIAAYLKKRRLNYTEDSDIQLEYSHKYTGYALYKPIAEHDQEKIAAYMKIYGKAYKIVGTIIALLGIIIMPFLGIIIKDTPSIAESISLIYVLFLFSTASSYFFSYRSSIIIASQRNYVVVGISYAVVIVQNILQILVLVVAHNYLIYLIIQVIAVLVSNILISKKAGDDYPYIQKKDTIKLTKEEKIGLLKNIKAITVTKLSGILVNSTDNIVITFFNGLITTGVVSNIRC